MGVNYERCHCGSQLIIDIVFGQRAVRCPRGCSGAIVPVEASAASPIEGQTLPPDSDVLQIARKAAASVLPKHYQAPFLSGDHDHFTTVQVAIKAIQIERARVRRIDMPQIQESEPIGWIEQTE